MLGVKCSWSVAVIHNRIAVELKSSRSPCFCPKLSLFLFVWLFFDFQSQRIQALHIVFHFPHCDDIFPNVLYKSCCIIPSLSHLVFFIHEHGNFHDFLLSIKGLEMSLNICG